MSHEELEARILEEWEAGRMQDAATIAITGYGPEIMSYLMAVLRDEADAGDVFSGFCEAMWRNLEGFRWESTFRTWAYVLARHSLSRRGRDVFLQPGRAVPLSQAPEVSSMARRVRTRTLRYLRTEVKDQVTLLREQLTAEEQSLFILRINRRMTWDEIARVMVDDERGAGSDPAVLLRKTGALRKQFQRAKAKLRELAREQNIIQT